METAHTWKKREELYWIYQYSKFRCDYLTSGMEINTRPKNQQTDTIYQWQILRYMDEYIKEK